MLLFILHDDEAFKATDKRALPELTPLHPKLRTNGNVSI
jgi:hypothetical protein